ncbi:UDP-glucuronosyltransferase 1A1-like isoform X1 [Alosa sapidissima]|uniref:UDP-glucuronosyltransferase 1A1-like isoform X1 n=1 Tax=Alosa sapidissima TaxID=34773 RepID=UPI001C08B021|nr:UDP-glucuronosyltransferase 1A1-like isoform X1 [Alosa sapidissima]
MAAAQISSRRDFSRLLIALFCVGSAQGGKLLVIPADGSHWTGMKPLVEELGRRGNQVVVVIPEASLSMGPSEHTTTLTFPVPYTKESMKDTLGQNLGKFMSMDISTSVAKLQQHWMTLVKLSNFTMMTCESLLYNKELMQTLRDYDFDALLTDGFSPVGIITGAYLDIPSIYTHGFYPCPLDIIATRCPSPVSYVPRRFTHFSNRMNLWERTINLLRSLLEPSACSRFYLHADKVASDFLQRETSIVELASNAALWFMYYDFTFEFPMPLMPNMIMIGGMQAGKSNPLPQEVEKFVSGSGEHGFVVFTLGSMVSQMPEDKARVFFEAFRQIPQRVLWRYTGPVPENAPENVKLMKWLPQNDLLGHPLAKAFITHGGSHGIYEGICNGVPMVMLPLFGDQADNVQRMVARGVAESLTIADVTTAKLLEALNKVINDKSYKANMMKLSAVHNDRPIKPLDLAVFWTEFVMRHQGAEHLRPAAHELNWIQYHSLDVIALLTTIVLIVVLVTFKSCMFCLKKCTRNKTKQKKNKRE